MGLTLTLPAWMNRGACRHTNPDLFSPDATPDQEARARRICRGCPVLAECGAWAEAHDEWGVWAGRMRRHRHVAAMPELRDAARELFAEGESYRAVAERLDISLQTAIGFYSAWRRERAKRGLGRPA